MGRTMIHENHLPKYLWAEAVDTSCNVQNRIYIRRILNKTSYELFKGRKSSISYFHQFGCTCFIMNSKVYLKKFDAKAQKGIFLGYFDRSKAYKMYNSKTNMIEEFIHVNFYDKGPDHDTSQPIESVADFQVSEEHPEPGPSEVSFS